MLVNHMLGDAGPEAARTTAVFLSDHDDVHVVFLGALQDDLANVELGRTDHLAVGFDTRGSQTVNGLLNVPDVHALGVLPGP